MDNNTNNNISNVSDIKFDDTPAESFDNLYGSSNQQSVNNVNVNQAASVAPNPGMVPNVNQAASVAPNPGMVPNVNQAASVAPNPGMVPNVNQAASVAPNPGMVQPPVEDLSNMDIDDEKMQSIEEQLSKTSQYNPSDFQQEQITIPTDNQYEKNKSGLTFLIVLFVILGVAILLIPQVTKFIK